MFCINSMRIALYEFSGRKPWREGVIDKEGKAEPNEDYAVACAKDKKCLNFASSGSWHLKGNMETRENDFQIYRPINDPRRAVCSLERGYRWGNIQKLLSGNNFWLECPTGLRSTPLTLSYIFNALFRDTLLGQVFCAQPNSQISKYLTNLAIWLFGCVQ